MPVSLHHHTGGYIIRETNAGLTTVERVGHDELVIVVGMLLLLFFVLTGVLCEVLYRRRLLGVDVSSSISAGICFGLSACSARCGMLFSGLPRSPPALASPRLYVLLLCT